MKKIIILLMAIAMISCKQKSFDYPETRKVDTVDDYFDTFVADPYRWLEDDTSQETAAWVEAQNKVTFEYIGNIPFRDDIRNRLENLWNYPRMGVPNREGDYYFYSYNDGLQNQDVIYIKQSLDEEGQVFLDPNTFSDDGTVALTNFTVSNDHRYVGYGISRGGSDWREFFVKEIESGKVLEDHLEWIKFSSMSWYRDGFFYNRFNKPEEGSELSGVNQNSKLYYHKAGTPQEEDELIYEDPQHPGWSFNAQVTKDEDYLVITVYESTTGNAVYIKDLNRPEAQMLKMVDNFNSDYMLTGSDNGELYFLTNADAPMYRLIKVDAANPTRENWEEIIPEDEEKVLMGVSLAGGKLLVEYQKDARSQLILAEKDGSMIGEVDLPGLGSVGGISSEDQYTEAFYSYTSFDVPAEVHRLDVEDNTTELYYRPEVDFDPDQYETNQIFYTSKDGTKVPMFIVHKKGIELDGKRPTLLYGYGGFNISRTPFFSITNLIWLENNGVYALANIRGGGEYGEEWHQAGTLFNKQNVFDDFIAAGEYLVDRGYTNSNRLTIMGGSNGGLLVGAVTNQRPDLFAVSIPAVGVMDMLRFHKFTIGRYWVTDYGSSEDPEQFEYLLSYSPLHNIREDADYPAVLASTADHDDRVVPAHSFKYIATLQEKYKGENPVMIRIDTDAGHGAGKPVSMIIDEYADKWAFAFKNMDFEPVY